MATLEMRALKFSFIFCLGIFELGSMVESVPQLTQTTAGIFFPSEDTNIKRKPSHNRKPLEDLRLCYENELLYPGDNEGDWVCDCKPGYVHYPATGKCYEVYTQGPCNNNQIIVLKEGSNIPECVKNRCDNGKIFYNDNCYPLNSEEACRQYSAYIGRRVFLVPDPTTMNLICADEDFRYACVIDCCIAIKSDSGVVYPESDTNENRKPQSHMRQPVTSSKCGEGELLYPGDTAGDWTCDCRPTFLYDPGTMKCYRAYSKGPCQANEIFFLPKSSFIPKCEQNICGAGRILFNNVCAEIDGFVGCKQPSPGRFTHRVVVDATTLQLTCLFLTHSRSPEPIDEKEGIYETKACFIGGKRSQEGLCPTSES